MDARRENQNYFDETNTNTRQMSFGLLVLIISNFSSSIFQMTMINLKPIEQYTADEKFEMIKSIRPISIGFARNKYSKTVRTHSSLLII